MQTGVLESVHVGARRRIPTDALTDLVSRLRHDVDEVQPTLKFLFPESR